MKLHSLLRTRRPPPSELDPERALRLHRRALRWAAVVGDLRSLATFKRFRRRRPEIAAAIQFAEDRRDRLAAAAARLDPFRGLS